MNSRLGLLVMVEIEGTILSRLLERNLLHPKLQVLFGASITAAKTLKNRNIRGREKHEAGRWKIVPSCSTNFLAVAFMCLGHIEVNNLGIGSSSSLPVRVIICEPVGCWLPTNSVNILSSILLASLTYLYRFPFQRR